MAHMSEICKKQTQGNNGKNGTRRGSETYSAAHKTSSILSSGRKDNACQTERHHYVDPPGSGSPRIMTKSTTVQMVSHRPHDDHPREARVQSASTGRTKTGPPGAAAPS